MRVCVKEGEIVYSYESVCGPCVCEWVKRESVCVCKSFISWRVTRV